MTHVNLMRQQWTSLCLATVSIFAVALALLPLSASANSPFSDEQGGAIREGLNITGGYAERFALDADGETVYMATNSPQGLWSWNGTEWTNIPTESNVDVGAGYDVVATDIEGTALMTAGRSLWKTEDYGQTITEMADEDWNLTVLEFRTDEQVLYGANGEGQLLKSADYGATVTAYDVSGTAGDTLWAIGFGPDKMWALAGPMQEEATVYYSEDQGETWTATDKTGEYDNLNVRESDGLIVIAGDDAVEYSSDDAATWTDMGHPTPQVHSHITFSGSAVYVGPSKTTDLENWTTPYAAATTESNLQMNQLLISGSDIWTTCFGAPCYSEDSGTTFVDARSELYAQTVADIAQSTDKERVILALLGGITIADDFYTQISSGANPTWGDLTDPSGDGNISSVDAVFVDKDDSDILLAAFNSELWRTTDGGTTWSQVSINLEADAHGAITDIYQDGTSGNIYAAWSYYEGDNAGFAEEDTVGGGLYMSEDQGETWTDMGLDNVPANVVVTDADENVLVGVGYEWEHDAAKRGLYLYRGSSWTHLTQSTSHPMYDTVVRDAIYISGLGRFIAITGETDQGGMYRSGPLAPRARWTEMGVTGENQLPSDFWGTSIVDDPSGVHRVLVSHSRPSATADSVAKIYACYPRIGCHVYYEGLRDERFNALLFDGLLLGTNSGFAQMQARTTFALNKKLIRNGEHAGEVRLTAVLRDAASNAKLNDRTVKFYRKTLNGKWKYAGEAQVEKGKARIWVEKGAKAHFYKAVWNPTDSADVEAYGDTKMRTTRVKVKKLPTT